jgi:hypothetical protein
MLGLCFLSLHLQARKGRFVVVSGCESLVEEGLKLGGML